MPPKKDLKKATKACDLCTGEIKTGEDALQCSGTCRTLVHRYCAGVTITHYKELLDSSSPFICLHCTQKEHADEIKALRSELESISQALAQVQLSVSSTQNGVSSADHRSPSLDDPPQSQSQPASPISTTPNPSNRSKNSKRQANPERKFNIVIYGLKESPKGTPKYNRICNDVKSVSETINSLCPELTEQSVCDCVRLGKYSIERSRPVLVKLARSCDASNILANRHKLSKFPNVSIKPHMSVSERVTESTLLKERRVLINSGVDKSTIKLRGNCLYINKAKHGTANGSNFTPCVPNIVPNIEANQHSQSKQSSPSHSNPPTNQEQLQT